MKRLLATIGTVGMLSAGAAFAQDQDWDSAAFQGSYDQIQQAVQTAFDRHGVDYPVEALTVQQLGSIQLLMNDTEMSQEQKRAQLETIVTETAPPNR